MRTVPLVPRFSALRMTVTLSRGTRSSVPSLDALSTTRIALGDRVWRRSASSAWSTTAPSFIVWMGTRTRISSGGVLTKGDWCGLIMKGSASFVQGIGGWLPQHAAGPGDLLSSQATRGAHYYG